jgi:drug/metabolite transporter (DMT)-like permease
MTNRVGAPPQDRPAAVHLPPAGDAALMALAVVAVSTSGPLMASAATVVPALAIPFWRNAMAAGALAPGALLRRMGELRAMGAREWALCLAAGLFLAGHFGTWTPSLTFTPVASATALVATQPVWQAILARALGFTMSRSAWVGLVVAVAGAGWLSGADLSFSVRHLIGDGLAVAGAIFGALYVGAGEAARRTVTTTTYTFLCYGTAAVTLLAVCLVGGLPLGGYPGVAWGKLVALAVGAQLLGHSLFNVVLRTTSATVVALAILLEVPGAALIAAVWLHQVPPAIDLPAAALILGGIAVVTTSTARRGMETVPD